MNYVLMFLLLLIFGVLCFRIDVNNRIIDEMLKNTPNYKHLVNKIERNQACYMLLAITISILMVVCTNL